MTVQTGRIIEDLDAFILKLIKDLTQNLVNQLFDKTPVDTGFARTNWVPTIGAPFEGTAGNREEAEAGILNPGPQEDGLNAIVHEYLLTQGKIYITNNVEYIVFLNEGSSRQAPAAFVQRTIVDAIRRTLTSL